VNNKRLLNHKADICEAMDPSNEKRETEHQNKKREDETCRRAQKKNYRDAERNKKTKERLHDEVYRGVDRNTDIERSRRSVGSARYESKRRI